MADSDLDRPYPHINPAEVEQSDLNVITVNLHPQYELTVDIQIAANYIQVHIFMFEELYKAYKFEFSTNSPIRVNIVNAENGHLYGTITPS